MGARSESAIAGLLSGLVQGLQIRRQNRRQASLDEERRSQQELANKLAIAGENREQAKFDIGIQERDKKRITEGIFPGGVDKFKEDLQGDLKDVGGVPIPPLSGGERAAITAGGIREEEREKDCLRLLPPRNVTSSCRSTMHRG